MASQRLLSLRDFRPLTLGAIGVVLATSAASLPKALFAPLDRLSPYSREPNSICCVSLT